MTRKWTGVSSLDKIVHFLKDCWLRKVDLNEKECLLI